MILELLQFVLILAIAPLVTGIIRKTKAFLQSRQGPGILQPYYDLRKLFSKGSVVSNDASWLFNLTPVRVHGRGDRGRPAGAGVLRRHLRLRGRPHRARSTSWR